MKSSGGLGGTNGASSSAAEAETGAGSSEAGSSGADSSPLVKRKVSDSSGWALIKAGLGNEAGDERRGSLEGLEERERRPRRWKRWRWGWVEREKTEERWAEEAAAAAMDFELQKRIGRVGGDVVDALLAYLSTWQGFLIHKLCWRGDQIFCE
ncbi:hypothetical protein CRG98_028389 [Punica granatum]|uniref:Uncharacterized protein n=1 Tax=Punica granatum TaxID=22663 RepID=A0A2I0J4S7_PUNGR|nr:hypothetical protein CRG98_028389 [Punica granatum]